MESTTFSGPEVVSFPVTFGELVEFYENAAKYPDFALEFIRHCRRSVCALSLSAEGNWALSDLIDGSALFGHADELRGRSVIIATTSQLAAALALIELDGVARRVILYPPDLPLEYLPFVIESAEVDAIVSDGRTVKLDNPRVECFVPCNGEVTRCSCDRTA